MVLPGSAPERSMNAWGFPHRSSRRSSFVAPLRTTLTDSGARSTVVSPSGM